MRIDAHVHYTPPSLADNLDQFSEEEPLWGLLLNPGLKGSAVQGWATDARMIADMDAAGLDRVILQGEYRLKHDSCVERNNQGLELMRRWPDRISAFAVVQPLAGDAALDELKRCLDGGMLGIGELNPYGSGHRMDDPSFLRIVEACIDFDIPINLHVNEEVGHYYPGKSTTPLSHYYQLIERYPELKLILAHWGGGLLFYELMPSVRKVMRNVYYDTAASPLLFPTASIFRTALECIDSRKILFGSDYPLMLYPHKPSDGRGHSEPDFLPFLNEIDELNLDSHIRDDILGNNAARLLGLIEEDKIIAHSKTKTASIKLSQTEKLTEQDDISIKAFMAVQFVANTWPETRSIFERHGIPWDDSPVPYWEPIAQAAAVKGFSPAQQQQILIELNEATLG